MIFAPLRRICQECRNLQGVFWLYCHFPSLWYFLEPSLESTAECTPKLWGKMKSKILTLLWFFYALCLPALHAQNVTATSFEGIDASQLGRPEFDIDPNGAIGTKQYMEWVNVSYQAFDKKTFAPVWRTPQNGVLPWYNANLPNCYRGITGDGLVMFDRLASRWIIAGKSYISPGNYYFCVAVSNTDDLTSSSLAWYTYQFSLNQYIGTNSLGTPYFPDWPKFGTWPDGYYVSFDLEDPNNKYQEIGVVACALDRADMLTGSAALTPQCFSDPSPIPTVGSLYLSHSLIPADVEGTNPPPAGRHEYFVSIQNPVNDGVTTTSTTINLWDFHVDWVTPANSTFTHSSLPVTSYTPGCYVPKQPANTVCVPEPSINSATGAHYRVDSVGDRVMPRMSYRNFGTYESFVVSQTVRVGGGASQQTGIRWYELRGSGTPAIFQSGTVSPDKSNYRFMPSMAQDQLGNAAVGYSVASGALHPSIAMAGWSLPGKTTPTELSVQMGTGDEQNSSHWGDYTSMTVDPVDNCTFWYVDEYFAANQSGTSINWNTRIANFRFPTCP